MELHAEALSFRYSRRRDWIFQELSLSLVQGEKLVLLGPNGAGKSTLLRLLAGQLAPRAGRLSTAPKGATVDRGALRRVTSWMPQTITAVPRLTVLEQVTYAGWLAGLTTSRARARAKTVVEQVQLGDKLDERADSLSGGQLRRVGLAEALVMDADFLLLDEPTAGLDPAQRANFREILRSLDHPGLVVSTHQTDDVVDLFDAVAVLANGAIQFRGSPTDLAGVTPDATSDPLAVERAFSRFVQGGLH